MAGTRRKAALLTGHVEDYGSWLAERGYTALSARNELKVLGQVGRWLLDEGLQPAQLDEERAAMFIAARRAAGFRRVPGPRGMRPLLGFLMEAGVIAAPGPVAPTPADELLGHYRSWMVQERGLAATTILRYENTARRFLQEQASTGAGGFTPQDLTGADVVAFLRRECARVSVGSAKGRVAELRSILRFLHLEGITARSLGEGVPPVAGWREVMLPPRMSTADVQSLLEHCDRGVPVGVRDYAIIMLLARLGLRSIEVARLELRDVRWRTGHLMIRGKGRRQDQLPLPNEVGEALTAYLRQDGDRGQERHVFLTCKAPRGPIRADLVGDVVERACHRAGLKPVGPHRLRHALAAELLRQGADLVAISQVLRHQDLATTAHYAKVDLSALSQVAQPWPGSAR